MAKTPLERFTEKVDLIFDFSPNTPLFVRKADAEIDRNNLAGSVEILQQGLATFPDYSTAYIILGKAYTLMGDYDNALRSFHRGSELLGSEKTLEFYSEQIENIKKHRSPFTLARRTTFVDTPDDEVINENENEITFDLLDEEDLSELASKISKARMPPPKTGDFTESLLEEEDDSGTVKIYSETMGKIYMSQGNYTEAVKVFEHLASKDQEKASYYHAIIEDLKKKIK